MKYTIQVITNTGRTIHFENLSIEGDKKTCEGITIDLCKENDRFKVTVKPVDINETIMQIAHRMTVGLRNFHNVIIPDSGRDYFKMTQLVDFWILNKKSTVNNVCMPLYIFNGQDHNTGFAFGIIGKDYETSFSCIEPHKNRALLAYFKRLTIEISRGYQECPIPVEISEANEDKSITEYLFLRDFPEKSEEPWIVTLRQFCMHHSHLYDLKLPVSKPGMEPLWCSWTDWHSDNVTEDVILENVKIGIPLGIKNYIVDDGWFGPGLDSDWSVALNIGDWDTDKTKIPDVRELSRKIRALGGKSIIWCAPHAVGEQAECFKERLPLLVKDEKGSLVSTANKFNILCLRSSEAREVMADICLKLARDFETDGAKYDLYNCIPDIKCCNHDHEHDTDSMLIGLTRTMELIWNKVRKENPEYIVELKQNYGGPFLAQYGTMMRAGDTPYNPEGNFIRTAFIQAYSEYAINDYQTINNFDTPEYGAMIIIKMLAAGIPTYSMDLARLNEKHLTVLKNYNNWYLELISKIDNYTRTPLDADLNLWHLDTLKEDIYFVINNSSKIKVHVNKSFFVLNGTAFDEVVLGCDEICNYNFKIFDCFGKQISTEDYELGKSLVIKVPVGGMLKADKI